MNASQTTGTFNGVELGEVLSLSYPPTYEWLQVGLKETPPTGMPGRGTLVIDWANEAVDTINTDARLQKHA